MGCNKGYNLTTLSYIGDYELWGIEPSEYAILNSQVPENVLILERDCFDIPFYNNFFDLIFTSGVLMHVAPEDLSKAVREMVRVSNRYILIIEYYSEKETSIPYHGFQDLLWKRDYKPIFENNGLRCIEKGFLSKEDGFDSCTYWLFEKWLRTLEPVLSVGKMEQILVPSH